MKSRLLFKILLQDHDYNSPLRTHEWMELYRTKKNIIYECLHCKRHHHRKIKGRSNILKMEKIRKIMIKALER